MPGLNLFRTARLILRPWRETDLEPFAALNADPRVMEFFPSTLTIEESQGMAKRIRQQFDRYGFGLWAVELPGQSPFIGFVGLQSPRFSAPFTPCVEIGWRLAADYWGQGLAPEAARKALQIGFENFDLKEILSLTPRINTRSRRVMEKIGMQYSANEDFEHPKIAPNSRLSKHVLYRIKASHFQSQSEA